MYNTLFYIYLLGFFSGCARFHFPERKGEIDLKIMLQHKYSVLRKHLKTLDWYFI